MCCARHATGQSVRASLLMILASIDHPAGKERPLGLMMIILPLGPALALGAAESLRWGLVVLLLGGALWGWEAVGHVFPNTIPDGYADLFRALSQSSVLAGTLLSIYSYARMHELARERLRRSRGDLQRANAELRLSQQKLIVSEKMAALGRLTAGMAHEINSTLAGAINSVELAHYDAD